MPDIALFLHLQSGGEGAVGVVYIRQLGGVVELEEIDVICPQGAEALFNVAEDGLFVPPAALGGNDHILPHALQGLAQFFLAVGVHVGGVEVVDPAVYGPADQLHRVGRGNPLDGQGAEGRLRHHQFRPPQSDFFHNSSYLSRGQGQNAPGPSLYVSSLPVFRGTD